VINNRITNKVLKKLHSREVLSKIKEELIYPVGERVILFEEKIMGIDVILENNYSNFELKFKSKECDLLIKYDCSNSICKKFKISIKNDMELEAIPYKEIKDGFINLLEDVNENIYL